MATDAEARALGFITPAGTDRIRDGDDAITTNARTATGLHKATDARVTAVEDTRQVWDDGAAAWGLIDEDDYTLDVFMPNGTLAPTVAARIADQLGVTPLTTVRDVLMAGTSLTAGVAGQTPIAAALASTTGLTVDNRGWAGRASHALAARWGAVPFLTTTAVTIPAGITPVTIPVNVEPDYPATPARIAGIDGTATRATATSVTFTRSTAGVTTPAPANTELWYTAQAEGWTARTVIIEASRNDPVSLPIGVTIWRIRAMIHAITRRQATPRVLVTGEPLAANDTPTDRETRRARRAAIAAAFPAEYVPAWEYLATRQALTDAGITPTSQDLTDVAAGITPQSLRVDELHPNTAGNTRVAAQLAAAMTARGWTL